MSTGGAAGAMTALSGSTSTTGFALELPAAKLSAAASNPAEMILMLMMSTHFTWRATRESIRSRAIQRFFSSKLTRRRIAWDLRSLRFRLRRHFVPRGELDADERAAATAIACVCATTVRFRDALHERESQTE